MASLTRAWLGALLLTVAGASAALAATVAPMDLRALTQRADVVVVARCTGVTTALDALTHRPGTFATFAIDEVVKGGVLASEVRVAIPGGEVDGRVLTIAGAPSFTAGRSAVLFLTAPRADGARGVMGFDQGSFEVESRAGGPAVRAARSEGREGGGAAVGAAGVPLADFLAEVRGYLR